MDNLLLLLFQKHLYLQCNSFLLAWEELQTALREGNSIRIWVNIEAALNAAASISKGLWGQRRAKSAERKELRDSLGITESSPLLDVNMRDNFVHFDERLDRWWIESKRHNIIYQSFGNVRQSTQGFEDIEIVKVYDPITCDVMFFSQDFNLRNIAQEIYRIFPKVTEEANKFPWASPAPSKSEPASDTPPDEAKGK